MNLREETSARKFERAKGAAQHFKIGSSTLWLWVKSRPGFPQPIKAGPGVTLFDIPAIEAFLREGGGAP
jgi:predicted DNA-binding transcriptional regulator AlpA